jgi:hypothetical protein
MVSWVKIQNGLVVQKQPNAAEGFVEAPDDVVCGQTQNEDGTFSNPLPLPLTQEELLDILADVRWQSECGGIELNGIEVPTDDRSKLLINGAFNQALMQDDESFTRTFKISGAFVTLTNGQVIAIGHAIADHVQQCFEAEALVAAQIVAGTITALDQIEDAYDLAYDTGTQEMNS